MKKLILLIQLTMCVSGLIAQTPSEALENAIRVKDNQRIFIKLDRSDSTMHYGIGLNESSFVFYPLPDSTIFAINGSVEIYVLPLNPLNFSHLSKSEIAIDPVNAGLESGLEAIFKIIKELPTAQLVSKTDKNEDTTITCLELENMKAGIETIADSLKTNKYKEVVDIFNNLKTLSFSKEAETIAELKSLDAKIKKLEQFYVDLKNAIAAVREGVRAMECQVLSSCDLSFALSYVLEQILSDLLIESENQNLHVKNLRNAHNLCTAFQVELSNSNWYVKLRNTSVEKNKVNKQTISFFSESLVLSAKNEISLAIKKTLDSKTIFLRNYNLFVPEVSAGIAFTSFNYNSYSTTSDSTGRTFVASPTRNFADNFNVTSMINFNLFIPNTYVHPLIQFGAGINNGMPSIFTGTGLRINSGGIRKFAVSTGIAWTWLRELNTLSVGDEISGLNDIENDLVYKFSWPPRMYLGIQINL